MLFPTYTTLETSCPHCGALVDALTPIGPPPTPGDYSICVECLGFVRFDKRLTLEVIPDAEWAEIPQFMREELDAMRQTLIDMTAEGRAQA